MNAIVFSARRSSQMLARRSGQISTRRSSPGADAPLGLIGRSPRSIKTLVAPVIQIALVGYLASCAPVRTGDLVSGPTRLSSDLSPIASAKGDGGVGGVDVGASALRLDSRDVGEPSNDSIAARGSSSSRILLPSGAGSIGLELVDGKLGASRGDLNQGVGANNFNRVIVNTNSSGVKYKVSQLSAPPRLVLDILGETSKSSRTFETSDSEFVQRVRVGAHPDKSRIVIDLASGADIKHDVKSEGGQLVVTLAEGAVLGNAIAFNNVSAMDGLPDELKASPDLHAAAGLGNESLEADGIGNNGGGTIDSTLGVADGGVQKDSTEYAAPQLANTEEEQGSLQPKLIGLSIEPVGAGVNSVVVDVTSAGFFTLKRTAPSEYVLKLEGALLSPTVGTTLIAPQGSGQIRSVRPVVQGNDVLLRIFSAPEASLSAKASGGKIVIGMAGGDTDFMAQASTGAAPAESEPSSSKEATGDKPADGKAETVASSGATQAEDAKSGEGDLDKDIAALADTEAKYVGRLISLDLQDTDIDNALRIIAEVSNLNIIASDEVTGKVTLRLIDVPWDQALDVILRTNGLDKVQDGNVIRIAPVEKLRQEREALKQSYDAEEALEELDVQYLRVSYAKASELKPLVEGVISERGSVSYDERTNQLIIKDISKGRRNVKKLVGKLDLRTPQVLLETQIVEAQRTLLRDLGAEIGFAFIQSPATGNATGHNFPNSVITTGTSDFKGVDDSTLGFLFGSADGTKTLSTLFTALEEESRIRIISRPAVATTNNKQATIKSVEKIRIKTPSGGTSIATGANASAGGGSAIATEVVEIGIVLEVTPQASPDYFVLLDIHAKSSTIGREAAVDGIPSEIERSATSTVLVSSGQTFAMGGIYKITDRDNLGGVPFLKDVPFLGHLFRRSKIDNADEELLFFITPRIVEGSFDDAAMRASS